MGAVSFVSAFSLAVGWKAVARRRPDRGGRGGPGGARPDIGGACRPGHHLSQWRAARVVRFFGRGRTGDAVPRLETARPFARLGPFADPAGGGRRTLLCDL